VCIRVDSVVIGCLAALLPTSDGIAKTVTAGVCSTWRREWERKLGGV